MTTLQQPQPRKSIKELNNYRNVTESAPLDNNSYMKSHLAQKEVQSHQQGNNITKPKKLNLGATNFTGIQIITPQNSQQQYQQQQQQDYQYPQPQSNYLQDYNQPQQNVYYQTPYNIYDQQQYQGYPQNYPEFPHQPQISQRQIIEQSQNKQQELSTQQGIKSVQLPQTMKKKLSKGSKYFDVSDTTQQTGKLILTDIALKVNDLKKREEESRMKIEQEELDKKLNEEQSRISKLKAQARSLKDIQNFIISVLSKDDFTIRNESILDLAERDHKSTKPIQTFQNRSSNQRSSTGGQYYNKPSAYQKNDKYSSKVLTKEVLQKGPEDFSRGTNVVQISHDKDQPEVRRYVEDPSVKLKQEELKKNLRWLDSQEQTDEFKKMQKELKFKLNQLAPDNKKIITQAIVDIILVENSLAEYCAGTIMEKAWLEPRYRELYTEVCKTIVDEPKLTIEVVNEQGVTKKRYLFKDAILNRVQEAFESEDLLKKSEEELKQLSKHELEIQYIRRKNRILGNVRFIGDLFIQSVLPEQAIYRAQLQLLEKFLILKQAGQSTSVLQLNPEDQLEGLVELYDKAGEALEKTQAKKRKVTVSEEKLAIDAIALALNQKNFGAVKFDTNFSVKGIFDLFRVLNQQLGLSMRINILIQNLDERRRNGWVFHQNQKNESAKTLDELLKEQEDLQGKAYDDERKYRDKDRSYNKKSHNVSYQPKFKDSYHERDQKQYQEVLKKQDNRQHEKVKEVLKEQKKDIKQEVKESFDVSCEEQIELLCECINRGQQMEVFWESFFDIILEPKQKNVERVGIFFEITKNITALDQSFKYGLQQKFKDENYLWDLFDSQLGVQLYQVLLCPFFEHDRSDILEDLLRPAIKGEAVEQWDIFLKQVATLLLQKSKDLELSPSLFLSQLLDGPDQEQL